MLQKKLIWLLTEPTPKYHTLTMAAYWFNTIILYTIFPTILGMLIDSIGFDPTPEGTAELLVFSGNLLLILIIWIVVVAVSDLVLLLISWNHRRNITT